MSDILDFMSVADRRKVAQFLGSDTGQRLIAYLRDNPPEHGDRTEADLIKNAVGFTAHSRCVKLLKQLTEVSKPQTSDELPPPLE